MCKLVQHALQAAAAWRGPAWLVASPGWRPFCKRWRLAVGALRVDTEYNTTSEREIKSRRVTRRRRCNLFPVANRAVLFRFLKSLDTDHHIDAARHNIADASYIEHFIRLES